MGRVSDRLAAAAGAIVLVAACGTTVPQVTAVGVSSAGQRLNDGVSAPVSAAAQAPGGASQGVDGTVAGAAANRAGSGSNAAEPQGGTSPTYGGGVVAAPTAGTRAPGAADRQTATTSYPGRATKPGAAKPATTATAKSTTAASSAAGAAAGASGRGFTASTIDIGYADSDVSTYSQTLGVSGDDTGDTKAQVTALANYVNTHGGILGHNIVLHEYTYSTAEALNDPDQSVTAACDSWTQDDHVFAVVNSQLSSEAPGIACMARAGTPVVDATFPSQFLPGVPEYQQYPSVLFAPSTLTAEKFAQLYVGMMQRTKYLTGWNTATGTAGTAPVKVGLLVENTPTAVYAGNQIIADLKAAGYPVASSDIISYDSSLQSATTAAQSAIVKFRTDGVTHVVTHNLQFAEAAQSQNYFPRLAIADGPEVIAENYPASELAGSVAISASPAVDTDAAHQPAPTPARTQCLKIMTDAQQDISDLTTQGYMEQICDEVFTLANSLNAAGSLSNSALQAGYEKVGTIDCATTYLCQQGPLPSGHASAQASRDMVYTSSCSCYTFTDGMNHTN